MVVMGSPYINGQKDGVIFRVFLHIDVKIKSTRNPQKVFTNIYLYIEIIYLYLGNACVCSMDVLSSITFSSFVLFR